MARPTLGEDEIAFLDGSEDGIAVHELAVKPFIKAVENNPCDAVYLNPSREGKGYYNTNRSIFTEVQNGLLGDVFIVGEGDCSFPDAVKLLRGRITLGGSVLPLERATERYVRLKGYEDEGSITRRELEDSLRDGSAIDDEKIDELVDGIIDFAADVNGREVSAEIPPAAGGRALARTAEESVVLLKNQHILPLRKGAKIALIGPCDDASAFEELFEVVGAARGYERGESRSDELLASAVRCANSASAAVVFLYPDESGRELKLPANRLVLLNALKRAKKTVIAVLCGDMPADMGFDVSADATLVAPSGAYAAAAVAKTLCGQVNPSGKLTRTAYERADDYFRTFLSDRDAGRMRIGQFVGYRRSDFGGVPVRYPFGFGLSYTKFKYSGLNVSDGKLSFTLSNVGGADGAEVAQIYVGAPSVTGISPVKQLKAFKKVFLKSGESRRVELDIDKSFFETFDPRLFADNVETGEYTIYVGSSAADIRLTCKRQVQGLVREQLGTHLADYFPDAEYGDAAVPEGIKLGKEKSQTPASLKYLHRAAVYALPVIALAFFLLASTLILSHALDYLLLSFIDVETVEWILYTLAVGTLALWPLLGSLNRKRLIRIRTLTLVLFPFLLVVSFILGGILFSHKGGVVEDVALRVVTCFAVGTPITAVVATLLERRLWRDKAGKNRWDKYYFEVEQDKKVTPEAEFEKAFSAAEEARKKREEAVEDNTVAAPPPEPVQFYDKRLTYVQMLRDCTQFLKERGLTVDEPTLENLLAAIFSTQLVVIPNGSGAALCAAVAEYFGRPAYIDNAEAYTRYEDLFTRWRPSANAGVPTNLNVAFAMARRETAYLHTVLIRHVNGGLLETLFKPFADVLAHRRPALPAEGGKTIALPQNLIIIAEVEGEKPELPDVIAEAAAALSPECAECEPSERKTILQAVGFERLTAMRRPVRDYYPLGEELWKKVDLLDAKCRTARIGNSLWIKTELHSSIVLACGGEAGDALDSALAAELVPWLVSVWDDAVCECKLSEALTEIFGADGVKRSLALAKGAEE